MTIKEFVEEFYRRTVGTGKACIPDGCSDLMRRFREMNRPSQNEIIKLLEAPRMPAKGRMYSKVVRELWDDLAVRLCFKFMSKVDKGTKDSILAAWINILRGDDVVQAQPEDARTKTIRRALESADNSLERLRRVKQMSDLHSREILGVKALIKTALELV